MKLFAIAASVVAALAATFSSAGSSFGAIEDRDAASIQGGACYKIVKVVCGATGGGRCFYVSSWKTTNVLCGTGTPTSLEVTCSTDGSLTCGTVPLSARCRDGE